MRHGISGRKLNRTSSHRKKLFSNLANSLIQYEQIETTLPKAKDLRPIVEKLVTIGKKGDLQARRKLISILGNTIYTNKLIDTLADRYRTRSGGYLRIIKSGIRYGDNAPKAIIEFVDRDLAAKPAGIKKLDNEVNS